MLRKRVALILLVTLLSLGLAAAGLAAANASPLEQIQSEEPDTEETALEQEIARKEEQSGTIPQTLTSLFSGEAYEYPLFVGVDDPTTTAFVIDPTNNNTLPAFVGTQVWGAAYDAANDRILFNNGSVLYEWPVGGVINPLGTMTDPGGNNINFVGLAWHAGVLYGTRNIPNEAVYTIDLFSLVATVYIDYADDNFDFGGLAADPYTGELYATNDDTDLDGLGLYRINLDGSATLIAPYPVGQTDIDGLSLGTDGNAYLVIDEPGFIYVYNFAVGDYVAPLNNPWTTAEVFSAGAWIGVPRVLSISLSKTVGSDPNECSINDEAFLTIGSQATYCYQVANTGNVTVTLHTLEDSRLGTILLDFPYELVPGGSAFITQSAIITASVINTATWTSFNPGPVDVVSDTDSAYVYAWDDSCPAGYEKVLVNNTDFEDFPPYGWTITNTTTGCSGIGVPEWTNTDPGIRGNLTGGSGKFAIADSDACGSGSVMNTTMTSAPLDFSGLVNPTITFHMDYNNFTGSGNNANFDVSLDGGLTWQNIYTWEKDMRGPIQVGTNLPGAGEEDVRVRWDYRDASWAWWWEVDGVTVTACGQFPEIEHSPDEITGTQVADEVVTHTLTISNLGAAPLTWDLGEMDDLVSMNEAIARTDSSMPVVETIEAGDVSQALDLVGGPQTESTPRIPDILPDSPFAPSPALLHDNGPLVNCAGCGVGGADESVLQNISLGMNVYGFGNQYSYGHRVADDFTIDNEDGWYVDQITFFAHQTNSGLESTIIAANLQIWDGPPDDPGSSVVFGDALTDRLVDSAWSGIYRVTEDTSGTSADRPVMAVNVDANVFLPPGTYWLDWQMHGDIELSGPWVPPITIADETTTGNGLQYIDSWQAAMDVGQQGFPFLIYGCGLGDIPWASAAPMSGSTPTGEASQVSVLFDSAGLDVGEYSGSLCLWSNDPDESLTTVPLTLTVVPGADLSLVKTASKDPVSPGETFEYTLVVENNGPDTASNTTLVDTLPVGVTFDSASAGCVHAGGVVTCDLGTMAVGEVSQVNIIVSAPEEEGVITNSATVSADELDMHPEDNSASLEITVILYRVYLPLATR